MTFSSSTRMALAARHVGRIHRLKRAETSLLSLVKLMPSLASVPVDNIILPQSDSGSKYLQTCKPCLHLCGCLPFLLTAKRVSQEGPMNCKSQQRPRFTFSISSLGAGRLLRHWCGQFTPTPHRPLSAHTTGLSKKMLARLCELTTVLGASSRNLATKFLDNPVDPVLLRW